MLWDTHTLYSLRHDTRLMMHVTATPTHVHANRTIWSERMRRWWDLGNERWMNGRLMNAWMQVIDTQDSRTMSNRKPRTNSTLGEWSKCVFGREAYGWFIFNVCMHTYGHRKDLFTTSRQQWDENKWRVSPYDGQRYVPYNIICYLNYSTIIIAVVSQLFYIS